MDYISQINVDNTAYSVGLPNIYINSKGNFNIETSAEIGNTSKGKINIESMDDIQIKPGDDIILYSHHRAEDKQDEVAVKVTDGDDIPVKLQLNAAELVLTTKDKTGNNANVMDVTVNAAQNTRGYLKVRAQAIDLRSETHGGIALQPKGFDSDSHMNKIKFEHGGGDGLEFGTFNTEKTSIFTDEYRFNKDGVWKMATRVTEASDKADSGDATTALKYVKQADDFYDVINQEDVQCTTEDIIKTASAFGGKFVGAENYSGTGPSIDSQNYWECNIAEDAVQDIANVTVESGDIQVGRKYNIEELVSISSDLQPLAIDFEKGGKGRSFYVHMADEDYYFSCNGGKISFVADDTIELDPKYKLKLGGVLDFGSNFNFGETDEGIEVQYKLTKKNATKDCGVIKVVGVNNHASNNLVVEGVTIAPGETETIDECSILDIIKLTNYMKDNGLGPWSVNNG